jgi:hypothetical protein
MNKHSPHPKTATELKAELDQARKELKDLEQDLPILDKMRLEAHEAIITSRRVSPEKRGELHTRHAQLVWARDHQEKEITEQKKLVKELEAAHDEQALFEHRCQVAIKCKADVEAVHETLAQGLMLIAQAQQQYRRLYSALDAEGVMRWTNGFITTQLKFMPEGEKPPCFFLSDNLTHQVQVVARSLRDDHPDLVKKYAFEEHGL